MIDINSEITKAQKARNATALNVLRSIKTEMLGVALRNGHIDHPVTQTEIVALIRKGIKQRKGSVDAFVAGKRFDLAEKEVNEIFVLETLLPQELSDEALDALISSTITELSAGPKDLGRVIKRLKEVSTQLPEGKILSDKVKAALNPQ